MSSTTENGKDSAPSWWAIRRIRYNIILLMAAPVSLVSLLFVWWLFESRLPCLEITGFSIALGGILFLVGLGLANLCYFFGQISEWMVRPKNLEVYRRRMFALGTVFSLILVFFPVIGNLASVAFGPAVPVQCG